MIGTLVVLKKTYDISQKKEVCEWFEKDIDFPYIIKPNDFEKKVVDAELQGKPINTISDNLNIGWKGSYAIKQEIKKCIGSNNCWFSAAVFFNETYLVAHIDPLSFCSNILEKCNDIDEMKERIEKFNERFFNENYFTD